MKKLQKRLAVVSNSPVFFNAVLRLKKLMPANVLHKQFGCSDTRQFKCHLIVITKTYACARILPTHFRHQFLCIILLKSTQSFLRVIRAGRIYLPDASDIVHFACHKGVEQILWKLLLFVLLISLIINRNLPTLTTGIWTASAYAFKPVIKINHICILRVHQLPRPLHQVLPELEQVTPYQLQPSSTILQVPLSILLTGILCIFLLQNHLL